MSESKSPSRPTSLDRNDSGWISVPLLIYPAIGITLLAGFAEWIGTWPARLLVLPVIAGLQNHLQILSHEGAHLQIHPNRRWNDFLTNLFCSIPFLGFLSHYRKFHLDHHRFLCNPAKDPEVSFYAEQGYHFKPMSRADWVRILFLDLCGYHFFQFFLSYQRYLIGEMRANRIAPPTRDERLGVLIVATAIVLFCVAVPNGIVHLLFYWVLPQVTLMFLFLKIQGYGEHTARTPSVAECTLSHESNWIVRFFIYPLNADRHREHHAYPTVPWYRLRSFRVEAPL